jgi:hypothetical protein
MSKIIHQLILDIHPIKLVPEIAEIVLYKDIDFEPGAVVRFQDGVTAELALGFTFDYEF